MWWSAKDASSLDVLFQESWSLQASLAEWFAETYIGLTQGCRPHVSNVTSSIATLKKRWSMWRLKKYDNTKCLENRLFPMVFFSIRLLCFQIKLSFFYIALSHNPELTDRKNTHEVLFLLSSHTFHRWSVMFQNAAMKSILGWSNWCILFDE